MGSLRSKRFAVYSRNHDGRVQDPAGRRGNCDARRPQLTPDNQPAEPFRIADNVYYVGSSDIGSYLITTPEGHVIIDGGYPETAPMIEAHVAQLGFKIADVKIVAYEVLNALDCHIFLDAHAGYYGGREKAATMREHPDGPDTFVDPEGYKTFIKRAEQRFLDQLASEKRH